MGDPSLIVLRPGMVFHGRYHVVRCIKAGGMGAVHEVLDDKTNAHRALKVMLPNLVQSADMHARFAQEARVCGSIRSEHIVHVTDAGVDDVSGTPFLVMELLMGEELGTMLARRRQLPRGEVIVYLHQAALALDKTHAADIVHRDLKPENLFVTRRDDGSPCVKVLDFGIAKMVAQTSQPQTTRSVGTPLYMAPEQALGDATIGSRTDIYALGHIAYTLLVGEAYWTEEFKTDALLPFFYKVVSGIEEPASRRAERRNITLPTAFDGWFLKATSVQARERFARATEAVAALAEALGVRLPKPLMPLHEEDEAAEDGLSPSMRELVNGTTEPALVRSPAMREAEARKAWNATEPRAGEPESVLAPESEIPIEVIAPESTDSASKPADNSRFAPPSSRIGGQISTAESADRSRAISLIIAIGIAFLAFLSLFFLKAAGPRTKAQSSAVASAPAPPEVASTQFPAPEPLHTVVVSIEPADAIAEVNGRPVSVEDGTIQIRGVVGSSHDVTLRKEGVATASQVAIAETGAVPDKLVLAMPSPMPIRRPGPRIKETPATSTATSSPTSTASEPAGLDVDRTIRR